MANRIVVHRYWIYALLALGGVVATNIISAAVLGILSHPLRS